LINVGPIKIKSFAIIPIYFPYEATCYPSKVQVIDVAKLDEGLSSSTRFN